MARKFISEEEREEGKYNEMEEEHKKVEENKDEEKRMEMKEGDEEPVVKDLTTEIVRIAE